MSLSTTIQELFGRTITAIRPVSGGDINRAYMLTMGDQKAFMKANRPENADFFDAEAEGLKAIKATGKIRTPDVYATGLDEQYGAFLLLEWSQGTPGDLFFENFGHSLAEMHRTKGDRYGFHRDNYIGAGRQENTWEDSWVKFFRDHRLIPQLKRADAWFDVRDRNKIDFLLSHLDRYLPEPEFPSLLHGDLWSGNYITGNDGEAWLIDPAVYIGHFESDLAMTQLFGGFPKRFYDAYRESNPMDPEYEERRDLYNLYHLLNHLNLFGGGYLSSVHDIIYERTTK